MKERKFVTVAHAAFKHGGHTRHKEIARLLIDNGYEVSWLGPSHEDIQDINGINHLPLKAQFLKRIPFFGTTISTLINLLRNKNKINGYDVFLLGEFELFATVILSSLNIIKCRIFFLQRSDIIIKSQIEIDDTKRWLTKIKYKLRIALIEFIYKFSIPKVTKFIVQTEHHKNRLEHLIISGDNKISVLPNNVNTSWISNNNKVAIPSWFITGNTSKNIVVVSNLFWKIKGFDTLFNSLALIKSKDFKLYIIGAGKDEDKIRKKIHELNLDSHIIMVGRVSNACTYLSLFDFMIVPTRYDDCPNVVLEGIYNLIPMIATNIDAHQFLLGKDFPLFSENPIDFSEAISVAIDKPNNDLAFEQVDKLSDRKRVFTFDWGKSLLKELTK